MDTCVLRICNIDDEKMEWVKLFQDHNQSPQYFHDGFDAFVENAADCRVIALVPSNDVLLVDAQVPPTSKAKMVRAVPYVLEDQLSEPLDKLHFAIGQASTNHDGINVAVVNKELVSEWVQRLQQADLQLERMIPEALAIPLHDKTWQVALNGTMALVRTDKQSGFAIEKDNLQKFLLHHMNEHNTPVQINVLAFNNDAAIELNTIQAKGIDITTTEPQANLLTLLAKGALDNEAINLLQGVYQPRFSMTQSNKPWFYSGALVGLAFFIYVVGHIGQFLSLVVSQHNLDSQMRTIYFQVFPDANSVVSPKLRMQQLLASRGSKFLSNPFLSLLGISGKVINENRGAQLKNVEYKSNQLNLTLQLTSFSQLEKIIDTIRQYGLTVKQQEANKSGAVVKARIQVTKGAV